ncbi:pilin [Patescibacteria group bacterium]|nr:pilin [Patescibacteria group bacterium]MBU1728101.1 pilin [Patescibacteria group bacterium]
MKKKFVLFLGFALAFSPVLALAQGLGTSGSSSTCSPTVNNIGDILCRIGSILNTIIPVLIVLGVVYFVWGVVQYVMASEEDAKKKGRDRMIWGIIGLVVIVGMWGLVTIITNTFGVSNVTNVTLPTVPLGI